MDEVTIATPGVGAPLMYDHMNMLTAMNQPNTIKTQNTALVHYFRRYLLQKAISVFEWELPANWERDYFLYCLYCWGVVAVINTDKFGVIPQGCGLRGYNVQYQPTNAIIANPLLRGIRDPRIGVECEILKLQPDFGGIMDLVNATAEDLALCSQGISVNLVNTKMAWVFFARNKGVAETLKNLYAKIASGEPAVFTNQGLFTTDGKPLWQAFNQNLKETYIAPEIVDTMHEIEARFDQQIGIPSANRDKKERLTTDEVNVNNVDTYSKCALWLESLQQGCERVNAMFGDSMQGRLSVRWRAIPESVAEEATEDE